MTVGWPPRPSAEFFHWSFWTEFCVSFGLLQSHVVAINPPQTWNERHREMFGLLLALFHFFLPETDFLSLETLFLFLRDFIVFTSSHVDPVEGRIVQYGLSGNSVIFLFRPKLRARKAKVQSRFFTSTKFYRFILLCNIWSIKTSSGAKNNHII